MKASVVINTYNRAGYISNAVRSIASQTYEDVELIVVNGPSTDETDEVLCDLRRDGYVFKLLNCTSRNLSESRNIGISACAGDVVFFIDDDGIAHRSWVEILMRAYQSDDVGAAGGFTIDHTGMKFQCRYTVCDRLGNAFYLSNLSPAPQLESATGFFYPSLLGTNCSFRRSTLINLGGFDEVFAYMLDETDVCLRIFDIGKKIFTDPRAYVLHKYAPSHTRTAERIPGSLLAPARSKSYFMLKHADGNGGRISEVYGLIDAYRRDIEFSNRWYLDHKKISVSHYSKISKELVDGISEGISLAATASAKPRKSPHLSSENPLGKEFSPLRKDGKFKSNSKSLRIYFVTQGYPPKDTSGIARWTHECATGLAELGHEVHVLTRSQDDATYVDVIDGVWVHFVADKFDDDRIYRSPSPLPNSILRRAEAVLCEVERCKSIWGIDVISAPIWDLEGILCAEYCDIPLVTSLHTTYKLAMPFKPAWADDKTYRRKHVDPIIAGERWILDNSAAILANSSEIVREINDAYQSDLAGKKVELSIIPHGLGAAPDAALQANNEGGVFVGSGTRLLFVGRLEERKGPDTFLSAIGLLPRNGIPLNIVIIGQSPGDGNGFVRQLNSLASKLAATHPRVSIRFLGHVDDQVLERAYANCDIFVAPSRFESFGLILIEAMRWKKPVLACDIGGMREVIENNVSGILFPVADASTLALRLEELICDEALRLQLGQAAFERYKAKFTRRKMTIELQEFFTKVKTGVNHEQ